MASPLPANQFLQQARMTPIIDVRSPGEFAQGHIPGAINIPLFDNEERALVGTKYQQAGRDAAVMLGLELIGPKLADFVKAARKIAPKNEVLVHCWRGGMRSASFSWLLQTAGMRVAGILQDGYKAFRQEVLQSFDKSLPLIVLGGKTGSGKTAVLQEMARLGEQVIDLEMLAHHKGSSYGAIGEASQPTVEQFENDLYAALGHLDLSRRIWVEDESFTIGTVRIPRPFYNQIRQAPVVFLEVSKAERIKRLVSMYTGRDHHLLEEATQRIKKRLGGQHYARALEALKSRDYTTVADITLNYYDKAYLFGLEDRESGTIHRLETSTENPAEAARQLVAFANENVSLLRESAK